MCEVGRIITLVWVLSSICELRLITWAATYRKCLKVINSWLALIHLMDIIKQKLEGSLGRFQGGWGLGRSFLALAQVGSPREGFPEKSLDGSPRMGFPLNLLPPEH